MEAPIKEQKEYAGRADDDVFVAWQLSHRRLRELERAHVTTVYAVGRIGGVRHDLTAQIAAERRATRILFEEVSRRERRAIRG